MGKPHSSGRPEQGKAGNIDAFHFTRRALEIQVQTVVFPILYALWVAG